MATRSLPERVSAVEEAVTALQNLPKELTAFRAEADARFEQIDARFDRLERLVSDEIERLYSRMRMLNEDLITRISTLNEGRNRGGTPSPRPGHASQSDSADMSRARIGRERKVTAATIETQ